MHYKKVTIKWPAGIREFTIQTNTSLTYCNTIVISTTKTMKITKNLEG